MPCPPPQDGAGAAALTPNLRETSMLYSWVQHRLGLYLEQLRKHLPHITEGGNLASVIEHCMVRTRPSSWAHVCCSDAESMPAMQR